MKLWRLTRLPFVSLDGAGPLRHGARWTSPGVPVVNFASEASLAILIVLRYLPSDLSDIEDDYILGHIETNIMPERLAFTDDQIEKRRRGDDWIISQRSLLAAVQSAVVPEADIVMMNPRHPDAARLGSLKYRDFNFNSVMHLPKP